ncbi:hypothetical protein AC481_06105 [miscellaneous Crenarchaeota group archaeon SMTZ-80]|nr:MAG: hypothetical protein AC481_06105 [miscellaneous Crenarchaeota group archaeon SMTZ-80]
MGKDDPKYIPLVGWDKDYVGRSPWDFYSWGHIALGIASFLLISLLITVPEALGGKGLIPWWLIIIIVLFILLFWEFFENVILWLLKWKFEERQDSFINFLWDVIFGMLGSLVMWLFQWIIMDLLGMLGRWFYIAGAISFGIIILAYLIGYSIYKSKNK